VSSDRTDRGPGVLTGDGVTLRTFERRDVEHARRWLDDAEFRALIGATSPLTKAEADEWFERVENDRSRRWYAVVRNEDASVVGEAGLLRISPEWRTADASIMIGERDARGQGVGTEAGRVLLQLAFDRMGLHRLAIGVVGFNEGALRFWERLGFRREGVQRDGYLLDGAFHDFVMMSLLEEEWRSAREMDSRAA